MRLGGHKNDPEIAIVVYKLRDFGKFRRLWALLVR